MIPLISAILLIAVAIVGAQVSHDALDWGIFAIYLFLGLANLAVALGVL